MVDWTCRCLDDRNQITEIPMIKNVLCNKIWEIGDLSATEHNAVHRRQPLSNICSFRSSQRLPHLVAHADSRNLSTEINGTADVTFEVQSVNVLGMKRAISGLPWRARSLARSPRPIGVSSPPLFLSSI